MSYFQVQEAVKALANTSKMEAVSMSSIQEQCVLRAVLSEYQRTGNEEVPFSALCQAYALVCNVEEVKPLGSENLTAACASLSNTHLLVACPGLSEWTKKYRLGIPVDDFVLSVNMKQQGLQR